MIDAVDVVSDELETDQLQVGSILTIINPATLSDTLWSSTALADNGIHVGHGDQPCGEFLIEDLLICDSYTLALPGPELDGDEVTLGMELAEQIAPQSRATMITPHQIFLPLPPPRLDVTTFDRVEAEWRTSPTALAVPITPSGGRVHTHLAHTRRPLHPARLHDAFTELVGGCAWSRGRIWLASIPERKIGWFRIGPRIDFSDGGLWLADRPSENRPMDTEGLLNWSSDCGDRGTWLAFTGDKVDPPTIDTTLAECELTGSEYARGPTEWRRYRDPLGLRESFDDKHLTQF